MSLITQEIFKSVFCNGLEVDVGRIEIAPKVAEEMGGLILVTINCFVVGNFVIFAADQRYEYLSCNLYYGSKTKPVIVIQR